MSSFAELGLEPNLLHALQDLEFENPTPIQLKSIPVLLEGVTDFVGLAQTGTGKTAAFGLPLIQLTNEKENYPQALIICPTRELCMQINHDLATFKKYKSIKTEAVYGGTSISTQISTLRRGVHIVAATPGRLIDLIERKAIHLERVKYVVLDEADEMLNMGFRDDIHFILENTPQRNSLWLFSATMPDEVREIANSFMSSPMEVTIGKKNTANVNIDHYYFVMPANRRYEALRRLIDLNREMYGIIFTRTKAGAQEIAEKMGRDGYKIEALHGDLSQQQRDRVMRKFRDKTVRLLSATDVAARGIDVEGITHVINFELPDDPEIYTHRSGRTGRAGKKGICFSLCHSKEFYKIREIERLIKTPLQKMDIPSGKEVCKKLITDFVNTLLDVKPNSELDFQLTEEAASGFEQLSKQELLSKIVTLELKDVIDSYAHGEDLNVRKENAGKPRGDKHNAPARHGFRKLFINLGAKDGFHKANFLQFILDKSDLKKSVVGRIDMKELFSYMEVENNVSKKIIKKLNGQKFRGRILRVNEAGSFSGNK